MAKLFDDSALDLTLDADSSIQTIEADTSSCPQRLLRLTDVQKWRLTPDPDLCLTPEKTPAKHVYVERHDRHVHFDVPNSSSESSVSTQRTDDGDYNNKENITTTSTTTTASNWKTGNSRTDDKMENTTKTYVYDVKVNEQHDIRLGPRVENHKTKHVLRENISLPENREIKPKAKETVDLEGFVVPEEESIFKRPEMHSTLFVGRELKNLTDENLNLKPKLEEKLLSTCVQLDKLKKKEKALNFESEPLFPRGLTDLDISENGMVLRMEREISSKVPRTANLESTRLRECTYAEPDIMECWLDSLETETYSSSLPGLNSTLPSPMPAQPTSVYEHLRAWLI